jgi:hypothetical protein
VRGTPATVATPPTRRSRSTTASASALVAGRTISSGRGGVPRASAATSARWVGTAPRRNQLFEGQREGAHDLEDRENHYRVRPQPGSASYTSLIPRAIISK